MSICMGLNGLEIDVVIGPVQNCNGCQKSVLRIGVSSCTTVAESDAPHYTKFPLQSTFSWAGNQVYVMY